jgi:uncharacterized membrane protein
MKDLKSMKVELHDAEVRLLASLRDQRRKQRGGTGEEEVSALDCALTRGQRIADAVVSTMGSWMFIVVQSALLFLWVVLNITAYIRHWDPYPFILLNLALSFQAAYAAPFIMMSQNRQQDIDRKAARTDYQINVKAELEIEALHQKIDQMREMEILNLTQAVKSLTEILQEAKIEIKPASATSGSAPTSGRP